jgi:hypothetical protein
VGPAYSGLLHDDTASMSLCRSPASFLSLSAQHVKESIGGPEARPLSGRVGPGWCRHAVMEPRSPETACQTEFERTDFHVPHSGT